MQDRCGYLLEAVGSLSERGKGEFYHGVRETLARAFGGRVGKIAGG